jgi:phosphate transport system substrate-binding protein
MRKVSKLVTVLAAVPLGLAIAVPASAGGHVAISGSGSSYASLAVDTWSQELRPNGIVVNYNPDGSPAGQADYIAGQDDFAVSDEPFRTSADKLAGLVPQHVPFGFSYIPAVAGGTALLYHLSVQGKQIRNLRLSGKTLMEIFTGQITNWDDPRITHDYGSRLPNLPIIPVIHTDLAGSTFYFTSWLSRVFPSQWNAFCDKVHPGIKPPCGPTQIYPQFGNAKGENGSINVADYIASSAANGAIGYDEYPYSLPARIPVLELQNPAGDYVPPVGINVTTALTAAVINEDPHSPHFCRRTWTGSTRSRTLRATHCPTTATGSCRAPAPDCRPTSPKPRARPSASSLTTRSVPARSICPCLAMRRCRPTWWRAASPRSSTSPATWPSPRTAPNHSQRGAGRGS